jgi:hypothetical protein
MVDVLEAWERCPKNYYAQNATAKERLLALHVMALAKNPS